MNCTRGKIAKIIQENTNAKENFIIRHLKSTLTFRDLNAREWEKSSGFGSKLAVIMFEKKSKGAKSNCNGYSPHLKSGIKFFQYQFNIQSMTTDFRQVFK